MQQLGGISQELESKEPIQNVINFMIPFIYGIFRHGEPISGFQGLGAGEEWWERSGRRY